MQKLHCKAAALLMGCSSGKLVVSIICLLCFVFIVVEKKSVLIYLWMFTQDSVSYFNELLLMRVLSSLQNAYKWGFGISKW